MGNIEIIKKRIKAIRRRLNKEKIDCLIVTKPANVTYATSFSGSDSWAIITNRAVCLLTDSRYIEQAQNQCPLCRIIERTGPIAEAMAKLVGRFNSVKTVTVEDSASLAAFRALKKNVKGRLQITAGFIEQLRSIKDSSEITAIRTAAAIAAKALEQSLKIMKPTIAENELAGVLDFQIRRLGAVNSFDCVVAFGSNASRPHHHPGNRKLRKNDTILIDFGVKHKNCCCDLTRCFTVGRPARIALYKKVYNAVRQAQVAAIEMIKAGVEISKIDAAARGVIAKHGLPVYGHSTGHGLGLEVHEEPVVSRHSKGKLEAGMVITIEPAVYIPAKLGIRIEDDILVTQTGYKILTRNCPHRFLPAG